MKNEKLPNNYLKYDDTDNFIRDIKLENKNLNILCSLSSNVEYIYDDTDNFIRDIKLENKNLNISCSLPSNIISNFWE